MNSYNSLYVKILLIVFSLIIIFSNLTDWQIYGSITGYNIFMFLFFLFAALTLIDLKRYYGLQNKYIFIPLFIFFCWWFFRSLLSLSNPLFYNTKLWQWILVFILFTNYISQNTRIGYTALFAYVLSAIVILMIYSFGNNVSYESGRLKVFDSCNPNTIGNITSNALLIIVFFGLKDVLKLGWIRILLMLATPGLFIVMIETGSRGALIYLCCGLLCYLLFSKIKIKWKVLEAFILGLISMVAYSYLSRSGVFQSRWIEDDLTQLGGRNFLWSSSFRLFLEKPLVGYGDGGFYSYLQEDPHNLYLVLLLTSGLIGFLVFMIFLYKIFKTTILNIVLQKNILCFVLYIISLVAFFKEGSVLNSLDTWIKLSIIIGLSTSINEVNNEKELNKNHL